MPYIPVMLFHDKFPCISCVFHTFEFNLSDLLVKWHLYSGSVLSIKTKLEFLENFKFYEKMMYRIILHIPYSYKVAVMRITCTIMYIVYLLLPGWKSKTKILSTIYNSVIIIDQFIYVVSKLYSIMSSGLHGWKSVRALMLYDPLIKASINQHYCYDKFTKTTHFCPSFISNKFISRFIFHIWLKRVVLSMHTYSHQYIHKNHSQLHLFKLSVTVSVHTLQLILHVYTHVW